MARKKTPVFLTEQGEFPRRLRALMEERGTTQEELGAAIGVTRQAVGNYVSGQSSPSWESLVAIAKHFDVSADYLLGLSNAATADPRTKEMCDYLGIDERSIDIIQKHSDAIMCLCSSSLVEHFFDALKSIDASIEYVHKSQIAVETYIDMLSNGECHCNERGETIPPETVGILLEDASKLLRLAVFDFSEETKRLAEDLFDIRLVLSTAKSFLSRMEEEYNAE